MATRNFFILGTDTHVGKTRVAVSLLADLKEKGHSTIGLKPIASGAEQTIRGLQNSDAIKLQKAASIHLPYGQVNPFCFTEAVAPHIAADQEACRLSVAKVIQACQPSLAYKVDYCIIEGAGGICVPLNEQETMLDLIQAWSFPVILVVGLRLGCLNHTLLTYESLINRKTIPIAAWLCNQIDPSLLYHEQNVKILQKYIHAPFLGYIPYLKEKEPLYINWAPLAQLSHSVI